MNGQALDLFGPGRYTLETQNIPLVRKVISSQSIIPLNIRCIVPIIRKVLFRYRRYYSDSTFDEYHAKRNLSAMENLFAGYVNARLDKYLKILQD